ncbi:hypothetical protein PINS_up023511 [Pythium insidiosum]|nr:hypothetical protein PINS_up023511 [Pythium insidiosum]
MLMPAPPPPLLLLLPPPPAPLPLPLPLPPPLLLLLVTVVLDDERPSHASHWSEHVMTVMPPVSSPMTSASRSSDGFSTYSRHSGMHCRLEYS